MGTAPARRSTTYRVNTPAPRNNANAGAIAGAAAGAAGALLGAMTRGTGSGVQSSPGPSSAQCRKRFIGSWNITVLATGQTYVGEYRADGSAVANCAFCSAGTWTCSGDTITILVSGMTVQHTISPDGSHLQGGCCAASRIGPTIASNPAATPPAPASVSSPVCDRIVENGKSIRGLAGAHRALRGDDYARALRECSEVNRRISDFEAAGCDVGDKSRASTLKLWKSVVGPAGFCSSQKIEIYGNCAKGSVYGEPIGGRDPAKGKPWECNPRELVGGVRG